MGLDALPSIIGELVKPAEKIKGISINHGTGLGHGGDHGTAGSPADQTIDAVLDLWVSLPEMQRPGETLGVHLGGRLPKDKPQPKPCPAMTARGGLSGCGQTERRPSRRQDARSAAIASRRAWLTFGSSPNHNFQAGGPWCNSIPNPPQTRLPRSRAAARNAVSIGV